MRRVVEGHPSQKKHYQNPGVFATYDVFDSAGRFQQEVSLELEGDPENDRLFWLDDDHVIRLQEGEDAESLELIYYELIQ